MEIIIDSRMRKIEKEYLSNLGKLIELPPQDTVYEEISGHPDIFFCKINDIIFRAPNIKTEIGIPGKSNVESTYPDDVKYNVCQIGKFIIHNFNFTDESIKEYINKQNNLKKIQVTQGYSNCSISVIEDNACITGDIQIYNALKTQNIDCLLVKEKTIHLLDKNGFKTKMEGFIGGSTCTINNKFILFGDINYLDNKEKLLQFIKKHKLEFINFPGLEINDYGGIIIIP